MFNKEVKKILCIIIIASLISISLGIWILSNDLQNTRCYHHNNVSNENYVPKTPSLDDYLTFANLGNSTIQDFFYYIFLKNENSSEYVLMIYYDHNKNSFSFNSYVDIKEFKNAGTNHQIRYMQSKVYKKDASVIWESQDGFFKSIIFPSNITTRIDIEIKNFDLNLIFKGKPFWYHHGTTAEIAPGKYVHGFEILGEVYGKVNDMNVQGYGVFERADFTRSLVEDNSTLFLNWIAVVSNEVKGIFYWQGTYKEAGIWIENTYKEPIDFAFVNLSIDEDDVKYYHMLVSLNTGKIDISGESRVSGGHLSVVFTKIQYNGTEYEGFSFIDTTRF